MYKDIYKISGRLIRGARPKSCQDLVQLGCTTIINLQSGAYDLTHSDVYESELPRSFGLNSFKIRCSDITPPTDEQVKQFLHIVNTNSVTYVHCLHGKDRTGFMCAVYRMRVCGWSYKDAVREMFSFGFHKASYLWWVPFLLKYRSNK